ncbi:beta strand repeat-containing protein [Rhodopirellula bahusiensis]|uniref:beta strand repeat-containing protein n=1 Tax=Rhodopirellula bahusiensis TaxID=2014065 RepID=UPI001E483E13|nr:Calx-beta domain-containing protein [Rhodopirellula bahusiensis]
MIGATSVAEGATAAYQLKLDGMMQAGETASADIAISFPGGAPSNDPAEVADFTNAFLADVDTAIGLYNAAASNGDMYGRVGNTLTYTQGSVDGTVSDLTINLTVSEDDGSPSNNLVEGPEDYTLTLTAAAMPSTTGATVVVGATNTVTTTISDNDVATWSLVDDNSVAGQVNEGANATYDLILDGELQAGEVAVVHLDVTFPNGALSNDAAEAADFDTALLTDVLNSITTTAAGSGTYTAALSGSTVVITYTHGGSAGPVDKLLLSVNTSDDNIALNNLVEGPEDFTLTISDYVGPSTSGAVDSVSPTEATLTTTIVDLDTATFTLTQPAAQGTAGVDEGVDASYTLTLDGNLQGGETASVEIDITLSGANPAETADFTEAFLQDVDDAIALYNGPSGSYARVGNVLTYTKGASDGTVADLTILLPTVDDAIVEGPETYSVAISNVTTPSSTGATIALGADTTATTMINDNDTATFLVDNVTVNEADGTMTFTVTLSNAIDIDVDVNVSFADVSATSPADYDGATQTLTFLANDATASNLTQTVTVSVVDDAVVEPNETFTVSLAVTTAIGSRSVDTTDTGTGTIVNDDAELSIADAGSLDELNDTQTQTFNFVVTRSGDTSSTASAAYTVSGADVDGLDFVGGSLPSGTVNFLAGESTATITVSVEGDNAVEMDEDFTVTLSGASTGTPGGSITITDAEGDATIVNDDIDLSVAPAADDYETNDTQTQTFDFVVTRYGDKTGTTTATYNVVGTGTNPADAADFGGTFPTGTVTFNPTETTATISITFAGDNNVELDENFTVNLTSPADDQANHIVEFRPDPLATASPVGSVSATILNDDIDLELMASPETPQTEGDAPATTSYTFEVTRDGFIDGSTEDTTVNWAVTGIGATPADAADFVQTGTGSPVFPSGTVTFGPNDTTMTITVEVKGDSVAEADEDFRITLSGQDNADITTVGGTLELVNATEDAVILNDDVVNFLVTDVTVNEGDPAVPPPTVATFEVTLDKAADKIVEVVVSTADGTAIAGSDYTGKTETLTFLPGETSKDFEVDITRDLDVELDETFFVNLTDASYDGVVGAPQVNLTTPDSDPQGIGTINNDDALIEFDQPGITIGSLSNEDGTTGSGPVLIVTGDITGTSVASRTVTFSITGGTATLGTDYNFTGSIVIPEGDYSSSNGEFDLTLYDMNGDLAATSGLPPVLEILNDNILEGPETLNIGGLGLGTTFQGGDVNQNSFNQFNAAHTIADDESAVIQIVDTTVLESAAPGTENVPVTLTINGTGSGPVMIAPGVMIIAAVDDKGDGTATSGDDYDTFVAQNVVFTAADSPLTTNVVTKNVTLNTKADTIVEADETVNLEILPTGITTIPGSLNVTAAGGTVTIEDDDTATVSIVATTDAVEPGTNGVFTVSLTNPSSTDTVISYTVTGDANTGTIGNTDYTPLSGTVTISAGDTTATIDVAVLDDMILEDNETVTVTLDAITAGDTDISVGAANSDTVTISDDDTAEVTIAATTASASEPSTDGQFTVALSKASDTDTVISYTVTGDANTGTIGNNDYTPLSGTVTILAGDTTATIDVAVLDDMILEDNETVTVTLDAITAGDTDISVGAANSDTVTISDDDTAEVTIAATTASASEPSTDGQFTVALSKASDTDTVISYTVTGDANTGTIGNNDYTPLSGTVTILAGDTTATIDVEVLDDSVVEGSESVIVTLDAITAGDADISVGAANSDTVTISDDDTAEVTIAATTASASEPSTDGQFTVALSKASDTDTVISYTVTGDANTGTIGNNDYTPLSGTVTILAGDTTATIDVEVLDDSVVEGSESVIVTLDAITAGDADISVGAANSDTVTISDDDMATISIAKNQDGAEGGDDGIFDITLSNPASTPTTINITLPSGFPAIVAQEGAGLDYTRAAVVIPAGATTGQLVIDINDDNIVENSEFVNAIVTGSSNPLITPHPINNSASLTIADNDEAVVVIVPIQDGNETGPQPGLFEIQLVDATDRVTPVVASTDVLINFNIAGTATEGGINADFPAISNNETITAGNSSQGITLSTIDDTLVEGTETVDINLTSLGAGTDPQITIAAADATLPDDAATIDILDNDGGAVISFATPTVTVDESAGTATVTLQISAPVAGPFSVAYTLADGTANLGSDYTNVGVSGVATFTGGSASETVDIVIPITDDMALEASETFTLTLGAITGAPATVTAAATPATVTITDNDSPATVSVTDVTYNEADATKTVSVTVDKAVQGGFTVAYDASTGTATAGTDYTAVSGTLDFDGTAGQTLTFIVPVSNDTDVEGDETINVTLGAITGTTLAANINTVDGVVTIANDDIDLDLTPTTISQAEGDSGPTTYTYTVTRTGLDTGTSTADWAVTFTGSDPADAADISSPLTGSVTFAPGVNTATIDVDVVGDLDVEGDDEFTVTLSNPLDTDPNTDSIEIVNGVGVGTIVNDDGATVSVADVSVDEGGVATVTLSLDQAVAGGLTVNYSTAGGTATIVDDFADASGSVTFTGTAGETQTFTIVTVADSDVEGDETVLVTLDSVTGTLAGDVTLGAPATVTITDNDIDLTLGAATPSSQDEGDTGTKTYTFTVTRTGLLTAQTNVDYEVAGFGSSPANADDFGGSFPMGTLNFGTGVSSLDITINVSGDSTVEPNEDFVVTLSNAQHMAAPSTTAADSIDLIDNGQTATIVNDDTTSLTVSDPVIRETSSGTTVAEVVVTLVNDVQGAFTVDYATVDGTAVDASDYVADSGTLNFAGTAGETKTISITVNGDSEVEMDEAFKVVLSNLNAAGLGVITTTPSFDFSIVGDTFTDTATTPPASGNLQVPFVTGDATLLTLEMLGSGGTPTGTPTFSEPGLLMGQHAGGLFSQGFDAMGIDEGVVLSSGSADAAVGPNTAGDNSSVNIPANTELEFEIDWGGGDLNLDFVFATEEQTGASQEADLFQIFIDGVKKYELSALDASLSNSTATGSSLMEFDRFTDVLTFSEPSLSAATHQIRLVIVPGGSGATLDKDDSAVFLRAGSLGLPTASPTAAPFVVTNTSTGGVDITGVFLDLTGAGYEFDTDGSTGGTISLPFSALSGSDAITGLTAPTLADSDTSLTLSFTDFDSGEVFSFQVDVDAIGVDGVVSASDLIGATLLVTFSDSSNSGPISIVAGPGPNSAVASYTGTPTTGVSPIDISDEGNVTIENDDIDLELLATTTPSLNEGDVAGDDTTYTFEVTRDGFITGSGEDTTVEWAIDFGASDADASDFETPTSGTLTFGPTETSKLITIKLAEDTTVESDEDFVVTLTNPANADTDSPQDGSIDLVNDVASATIANDDQVAIVIDDVTATEEAGTMTFTVSLDEAVDGDVVVDLATADGTTIEAITGAVGDNDFDLSTTQVTLNAGNSYSALVTVTLNDDSVVEGNETFTLGVSGITATIVDTSDIDSSDTGLGTITNTDTSELSVSASLPNAAEPGTDGEFTFSLTNPSSTDTTFTYNISGTATAGSDYGSLTGTATIPAGDLFVEVTVDVFDDNIIEPDETVIVDLDTITVGAIGFIGIDPDAADQTATVNIDSEDFGYIVVRQSDVTDGSESGPVAGEFVISLNSMPDGTGVDLTSTEAITVQIQSSGTATATTDFTSIAGTATIAIGSSSTAVSVNVLDDALAEGTETVTLTATALVITSPDFTLGTADAATVSIFDNDNAPVATDDTLSIAENSPNTTSVGFVSATDADLPADTLTYAVTGGTGSTAFAVDPATGEITVADSAQLDFEGPVNPFTLDVEVTDSAGNSDAATVTINLTDEPDTASGPRIAKVIVNSTGWTDIVRDVIDGGYDGVAIDTNAPGYVMPTGPATGTMPGQTTTLPWTTLDEVKVVFDQNVTGIDVSDFSFSLASSEYLMANGDGSSPILPSINSVSYDASTFTATLSLTGFFEANAFDLIVSSSGVQDVAGGNDLDGEWVNESGAMASGDGVAGGDFEFRILTLPGDFDGAVLAQGQVTVAPSDFAGAGALQNSNELAFEFMGSVFVTANYDPRADLDGDGIIGPADTGVIRNEQNAILFPFVAPSAMSIQESSADENDELQAKSNVFAIEEKFVDSQLKEESVIDDDLIDASEEIAVEEETGFESYVDAVDEIFGLLK